MYAAANKTATVSLITAVGSTFVRFLRAKAAFNKSFTTSPSTPFVENSLNHGILTEERKGEIFISIQEQKGWIRILIRDNGVGMDQKALDKVMRFEKTREAGFTHSIGISNINERLKLMYKEEYRLRMNSNPDKGMTVELMLPLEFGRKERMDEKGITD